MSNEKNKHNLFSLKGRISKRRFIIDYLLSWAVLILSMIILFVTLGEKLEEKGDLFIILWMPFMICGIWFQLAALVKRSHDFGKSGWWLLLAATPFAIFILPQTLALFNSEGDPFRNKYGRPPFSIISETGLSQISDERKIKKIILKVIAKNPEAFKQYKGGKVQILGFFIGQVMRATKGSANPELVKRLLKEILDSQKES